MQQIGKEQIIVPEKVKKKGLLSSLTYCKYKNKDFENMHIQLKGSIL